MASLAPKFAGISHERMEDGFLRSVGLGSDFSTPASLVLDTQGIYYDPTGPSDLETLLENHRFDDALLARARRFRQSLLRSGLSKYNVGELRRLEVPEGRQVVLVPGQVEDDASIELGCRSLRTNLGLLEAARNAHPDAYVIFKPHPDVLSGNRQGAVDEESARRLCDHIEVDVSHVVHAMTSLVGFEALLRELEVHCHGQPFYAGWGLTIDRHPIERRTRKLTLDELVAGTYFLYPRYLDRKTFRFSTPEAVLAELGVEKARGGEALHVGPVRRQLRKLRHIVRGVTRGA